MSVGSVTASASTAITQWYGNDRNVVSNYICNAWTYGHEIVVIRIQSTLYKSGLSWVSYNYSAPVKKVVLVGNRTTSARGTSYAQTFTISDLPGHW